MSYHLLIKPAAQQDMEEAAQWYHTQRPGLGLDFLAALSEALQIIQLNPYLFAARYGSIRQCLVKGFPYLIYYLVESSTVVVIAVLHQRRDPQAAKDRK
jgi:plasmid stabilization system protein ParE